MALFVRLSALKRKCMKTGFCRGGLAGAFLAATIIGIKAASPPPVLLTFRQASDRHAPISITAQLNKSYDTGDRDALLDVYYPSQLEEADRLPTVVWVHGGGFTAGSKDDIAGYLKVLAAQNFTVVGVNYSLAPARKYPTPVLQVNTALGYLSKNEAALHVDASKLFLAGDSAGAQIAAQLAIVISNSPYAKEMGVTPYINRRQLLGVILHSGVYDLHNSDSELVSSYIGSKDFTDNPRLDESSVIRNISADFPAMFISAGNADWLAPQARLLAETATKLGISVDSLLFPDDYTPPLPHEYQFNLETKAGQLALERTTKFITARSH
jgi:acetyl esterase